MAVPTGSGTEVLKAHSFDDVTAVLPLIIGVQFHTYTVLSYISYCIAINAAADFGIIQLLGNGNFAGGTGHTMVLARYNPVVGDTYVWNDKFSFFGAEPSAYTEPLSTAAEQVAIAAQGQNTVQVFQHNRTDAGDIFDITVSFLDQDWT
jgi:hypothetical protein